MITYRERRATNRIVLHHAHIEGTNPMAALASGGRIMGLLEVGYHLVINRSGAISEARPHGVVGAHCPGYNSDSIGVLLLGGKGGEDDFTHPQGGALISLVENLWEVYGRVPVVGHTELGRHRHREHKCPCLDMEHVREYLADRITVTTFPPERPPTMTTKQMSAQQAIVYEYLKAGKTLTNQVALNCLGVGSLSSRIAELRRGGLSPSEDIVVTWDVDRFGRQYAKYNLEVTPPATLETV